MQLQLWDEKTIGAARRRGRARKSAVEKSETRKRYEKSADRRKRHAERWRKNWQRYTEPAKRMKYLVARALRRAKNKGRKFEQKLEEILMAQPPTICACCNTTLDYSVNRGKGRGAQLRSRSPSLDRRDNREGYTVINTKVICARCNELKGDATIQELRTIIAYMEQE